MSGTTPLAARAQSGFSLFSHGFRPFFLIAGLWAPIGVGLWVCGFAGGPVPDGPLPLLRWHAHELLTGFVGAAMIGFLLTAIPNWTGRRGYAGAPLVALASLFLAARLVLLPGSPVPIAIAAPLALAVLPAMLLLVLPALVKARALRLFGPPAVVLAFWIGDLLMLGDAAGWWPGASWQDGQMMTANVAMLMVGLIGGRILPSFTLNALRKAGRPVELRPLPGVDRAGILALLAVVAVDLVQPGGAVAGIVAALAAVAAALRLSRWHGARTLDQPILWVLHLAYGMIPLALSVKAVWLLTAAPWAAHWLHLQTAGVLAMMIVAMMSRVTLGHTGRNLVAAPATVAAYVTLFLAGLLRVFGPVWSENTLAPLIGAAVLWVLGFGLFLLVHVPMLIGPPAGGKPR